MKIMNKFQKKLANRKKDNKGFSLVELIIVIAIMAILVGIVGTQVIPYINKSREAKDGQIVSSYSTAAVTAYSSNAAKLTTLTSGGSLNFYVYDTTGTTDDQGILADEIRTLTYDNEGDLNKKFKSNKGKKIKDIYVSYNLTTKVCTAQAVDAKGSGDKVLDPAVSDL